jgi:hypothetical protein
MFADAPQLYCEYTAYAPNGRQITDPATLMKLGLQRNYWGNPLGVGIGFKPAPALDVFGFVAAKDRVIDIVGRSLTQFEKWDYVEVEQKVIGPIDANHIGVVHKNRWRVDKVYDEFGGW